MLSLRGQKWRLPHPHAGDPLARLLAARGIAADTTPSFLAPDFARDTHAPELLADLPKARERLQKAIADGERILVVGDYDTDGVTAAALLFQTLRALGAQVSVRVPHRLRDGYGLNVRIAEEAATLGVKIILTCDNGISAEEAISRGNALGIETIVTDHHLPPAVLPPAFAIVNPRRHDCPYPFEGLSGASVAWKLATALLDAAGHTDPQLRDEIIALATIGTITDMCPLTGENRALVTAGLAALGRTTNAGLHALFAVARITPPFTAADVGFGLGPRLNAAGRLDDALLGFQTLTHPTAAAAFAAQLEQLNLARRKLSTATLLAAEERFGEVGDAPLLIASHPDWNAGVIGLAAGKLAEKYHRPVVLMDEREGFFTGSCRSPLAAFNITAALTECRELLTHFGGHRAAAGFRLAAAHRVAFEKQMLAIAARELTGTEFLAEIELDLAVAETDLTPAFFADLQKLQPFGIENPEPILFWPEAPLTAAEAIGAEQTHLKLTVGKTGLKAVGFGLAEFLPHLQGRPTVDLACQLTENVWQGRRNLELRIVDLR